MMMMMMMIRIFFKKAAGNYPKELGTPQLDQPPLPVPLLLRGNSRDHPTFGATFWHFPGKTTAACQPLKHVAIGKRCFISFGEGILSACYAFLAGKKNWCFLTSLIGLDTISQWRIINGSAPKGVYILKLYLTLVNGFRKHSSLLCNRVTQPTPKLSRNNQPSTIIILPNPFPTSTKIWNATNAQQMKAMILPTMYIYIYVCICIIFNIHIYIYKCMLSSFMGFFHVGKNFFSSRISLKTKVRMVEIAILTMGPFKDELPWRLPWRTSTGLRCLRWQRRKGGKNWCPLYMEKSLSIKKKV